MHKTLIAVPLSVALSMILVNTAYSNVKPQKSELVEVAKAEVEVPLCYFQTSDGRIMNLDKLCKQQPGADSSVTNVAITNPYNNSEIKKFDDDLYGKSN